MSSGGNEHEYIDFILAGFAGVFSLVTGWLFLLINDNKKRINVIDSKHDSIHNDVFKKYDEEVHRLYKRMEENCSNVIDRLTKHEIETARNALDTKDVTDLIHLHNRPLMVEMENIKKHMEHTNTLLEKILDKK